VDVTNLSDAPAFLFMAKRDATTLWRAMISGGAMRNKRHAGGVFMLLAVVLCASGPSEVLANASVVITAEDQFRFAETYFEGGEYYRAIGEYERFIQFFPKEARVELARYRIALSYFHGQRFKEAIRSFKHLVEKYGDTEFALKSYLKVSESYVKLKQYDEALSTLEVLLKIAKDQDVRDEAFYRGGWIFLEMDDWEKAQASFDKISAKNRDEYRLKELSEEMNKKQFLERKDPTTAGLLAIIPGAGHLYCERYRDALVAFLLNGAMIFAAVEAFDNDNEALGGLLTFFEIGLYSGNIYSAVNSAHKYNRKKQDQFLRYLKDHAKVQLSAGPTEQKGYAMALVCRITF
jgi:tetratricopeptide (TPR) repeat protein